MTAVKKLNHVHIANKFLEKASEIILGKENELKLMLSCILANGHLLIEDVPGVGKTTFVKTLQKLSGMDFKRIQFTNDLLPADIIGGQILNPENNSFYFRKGPIFCQLLLADEINRATPKTQSACLQAMEERIITIDGENHTLPNPFFVVATQNPTSNIGTFALPESQLDRFMMRIRIGFPSREAEKRLLTERSRTSLLENVSPVLEPGDLTAMQDEVQRVHVSDAVVDYVQNIVGMSRSGHVGLSPRAAIDLISASKAHAYVHGADFVKPLDVQKVAASVINHRIGGSSDQSDAWQLASDLLSKVKVK